MDTTKLLYFLYSTQQAIPKAIATNIPKVSWPSPNIKEDTIDEKIKLNLMLSLLKRTLLKTISSKIGANITNVIIQRIKSIILVGFPQESFRSSKALF